MATLTITSEVITENDLSNLPETIRVYSAKIDGRSLPDKWIVPNTSDDVTERNNFKNHLVAQGFLFI